MALRQARSLCSVIPRHFVQYRSYHHVLPSYISTSSPDFIQRAAGMDALVSDLESKLADARLGGGQAALDKMRSKGKLIPRERLSLLLDPDSPFLELSQLAGHDVYPGQRVPGAGLITGIGRIQGRVCVIIVNDASVKGGSYLPLTVSDHVRSDPYYNLIAVITGKEATPSSRDC